MVDPELPARLSEQQVALLRAIYSGLKQRGNWPTFYTVDKELDNQGLEINEVAATLPRGLTNVSVRPMNAVEEATLTVAGLSYVPEASDDVYTFMRILWHAIEAEREYKPPLDGSATEGPLITSEELEQKLGASNEQLQRLHQVFRWEPWMGSGGGKDDHFEFRVNREVRRYRGVQTIQEYVARRWEALLRAYGQIPQPGAPPPLPIAPQPVPMPGTTDSQVPTPEQPKIVFVIMPFDTRLDGLYSMVREACASLGVQCHRSDEIDEAGRITEQIYDAIQTADALVADISDRNPNVMYELGFAHAQKKEVIVLNTGPDAPFDVESSWVCWRLPRLVFTQRLTRRDLHSRPPRTPPAAGCRWMCGGAGCYTSRPIAPWPTRPARGFAMGPSCG